MQTLPKMKLYERIKNDWNSLPQSVKYNESIAELKAKMKNLGNIDCSCILCR